MEKGKAKEQPNHAIQQRKEKGKAEEQPNLEDRSEQTNNKRRNKEKGKAEEQPNLEDQQTKRCQRTENEPATAWETLVDCR